MRFAPWLLAGLVCAAQAVKTRVEKMDGAVQTILLSESTQTGDIVAVTVKGLGTRVYVTPGLDCPSCVPPITPRVRSVVGRRVVSSAVLVGPRGCDNAVDPSLAVEHSHCAANTVEERVNRERVNELWYLPSRGRNVDECLSKGGDENSCLGPPLVLNDNTDPSVPRAFTDRDLLFSRGVDVYAASGWLGAIPSVVRVDMIMPNLFVSTSCSYGGETFTAQYETFHYDAFSKMVVELWFVFARADGFQKSARVGVWRTAPTSRSFYVGFDLAAGMGLDDGYFIHTHRSKTIYTPANNLQRWSDLFPFDVPVQFDDLVANTTCNATFSIVAAPNPPVLRPPERVSDRTFMKSKIFHPEFYETASCNYAVGEYDSNLELKYAYTPDGALRGGYAVYVTPEFPHLPIFVPPNSQYDPYQDNCDKAYPRSATFKGFACPSGPSCPDFPRMVAGEHRCYAPFLIDQKITDANVVEERELQCTMQGMSCAGRTCNFCQRRITSEPCRVGYMQHDGLCIYKVDWTKQLGLQVPIGESTKACASVDSELGAKVFPILTPDVYLKAWLQRDFVHWKKQGAGYPYRLPVQGGDVCDCYDYQVVDPNDPTLDVAVVKKCLCNDKAFPICAYRFEDYEIMDRYISHAPETLLVLQKGNPNGGPSVGAPAKCNCYNGSGGVICQQITCPVPIVESADVTQSTNNLLTRFANKGSKHGACFNGQPRDFWCEAGYTPDATVMPSNSLLPWFADVVCACPASSFIDDTIVQRINNNTFTSAYVRPACGGIEKGACTVDDVLNEGVCRCVRRRDTSPGALEVDEPSMGGPACLSRVAKVPPHGYALNPPNIAQAACNGRGISCGGGNTAEVCFDSETRDPIDGCVCPNGRTGEACTCPAPVDLADVVPTQTTLDNRAFVDLGSVQIVTVVRVAPRKSFQFGGDAVASDCTDVGVGLSTAPQAGMNLQCVAAFQDGAHFWTCSPGSARYRFVVVNTLEREPRCDIFVYERFHEPCGDKNKTNPTAAAFSDNEINRRFGQYVEPQNLIKYGPYGCTNSECMCNPNHSGMLCNAGISSIKENANGQLVSYVCGETTLPPRGYADPKTGKCVGADITTSDNTGEAGVVKGFFTGEANECFMLFVHDRNKHMLCAGRGECVAPKMPWGTCVDDLTDFENDPLFNPFIKVPGRPPVSGEFVAMSRQSAFFRQYDSGAGDLRTVVTVDEESWFLGDFQRFSVDRLYVDPLTNEFETCSMTVPIKLDFTLLQSDAFARPQRAVATVTIFSLQNICGGLDGDACVVPGVPVVETCDPRANKTSPLACSTRNYCRDDWIKNGSINPSFFQQIVGFGPTYLNSVAHSEFDQVRRCIGHQTWHTFAENDPEFAQELPTDVKFADAVMTCARGRRAFVDNIPHKSYGDLDCNNPVHRLVDRGLWLLHRDVGDYPGLCIDRPIGPYTRVLGWGYGLFKNLIPDLSFDLPEDQWTDEHWRFLSSMINDELWFDSRTNRSVDGVFTPGILDQYNMQLVNKTLQDGFVFNGSIFLDDPDIGVDLSKMLFPFINFDFMDQRDAIYDDLKSFDTPYSDRNFTQAYFDWFTDVLLSAVPNTVKSERLLNLAQRFVKFRRPGFVQGLGGFNMKAVTSLQVTFPFAASSWQFYTDDGQLCATVFNVVPGQKIVFDCQTLTPHPGSVNPYQLAVPEGLNLTQLIAEVLHPTNTYPPLTEGILNIFRERLIVQLNPNATANQQFASLAAWTVAIKFVAHWQGPKTHIVPHSFYSLAPSINESFHAAPTVYRYSEAWFGPFLFPVEQTADNFYNASFKGPEFVIELNSQSYQAAWSNLTQAFIVHHRAPFNEFLRAAYRRTPFAYSVPVDVAKPEHRQKLRDTYYSFLGPRKCTADIDCDEHSRKGGSTCVRDSYDSAPWRNGDPSDVSLRVGDEGGCEPYQRGDLGFSDGQLLNEFCTDGWGPRDSEEWRGVVDQNQRLAAVSVPDPLFPTGQSPFSDISNAATGDIQLDLINSTIACRLPWDLSTQGKLCGGHGLVSLNSTNRTAHIFVHTNLRGEKTTQACTGVKLTRLGVSQTLWMRNTTRVDPAFQGFENGNTSLVVLGGELFFRPLGGDVEVLVRGTECAQVASNTRPFICDYVSVEPQTLVQEASMTVECLHTSLYDAKCHVDLFVGSKIVRTPTAASSPWIRRVSL